MTTTTRLVVTEVGVSNQLEAYNFRGDDGFPTSVVFSPVYAKTADGREFYLPQGDRRQSEEGHTFYATRYQNAARVAERVRKEGTIDPDYWVELEPMVPLEEQWRQDALREQYERAHGGHSHWWNFA